MGHMLSQIQFSFVPGASNCVCLRLNLATSGLDHVSNNLTGSSISILIPPIHFPLSSQRGFLKFISDHVTV